MKHLITAIGAFALALSVSYVYGAWNPPTQEAPNGNTLPPITVSSDIQTKQGDLIVKVLSASGICLNGDCRTSWPTTGSSTNVTTPVATTTVIKEVPAGTLCGSYLYTGTFRNNRSAIPCDNAGKPAEGGKTLPCPSGYGSLSFRMSEYDTNPPKPASKTEALWSTCIKQ
jgi:hypothetical protein